MATFQVALQKTSRIRMLDPSRFRALVGSGGKQQVLQQARPPEIVNEINATGENFTHLKLTAEKMLQEQACAKSGLEILNAKLHKAEEQIEVLETKLQEISNENTMLRVKHKEDTKLWNGLESRFMSTQAFFDQITETLHSLEAQIQQGEFNRRHFEEESRKEKELLLARIAAAEKAALDIRRHWELQLEAKQAEMCKQLGELSQRHDQILNDMERQFQSETEQAVLNERSKAENEIQKVRKHMEDEFKQEKEVLLAKIVTAEEAGLNIQRHSEQQLEAKQAELSKQLAELSQRHDRVLNDMKRQFQSETEQAVSNERSKAEDEIQELKKHFEQLMTQTRNSAAQELEKSKAEQALETRRQLETQLEAKEAEMSRHLKELAQRDEEARKDVRRKHEEEMSEVILKERAKAENEAEALKRKYEQLLVEARKSALDELQRLKAEHDSTIKQLGELYENNLKTTMLRERESMARTSDTLRDEMTNNMKRQCEMEVEAAVLRERETGKMKYEKLLLEARDSAARELEKLKEEHAAAMDKMKEAHEAKLKARSGEAAKDNLKPNKTEESTMTKTFTKRKVRAAPIAKPTAKRKKAASTSTSDDLFGNGFDLDPYDF